MSDIIGQTNKPRRAPAIDRRRKATMSKLTTQQAERDKRMTKEELLDKRNVAYNKIDGIFYVAIKEASKIQDEAWAVADNEYRVELSKLAGEGGKL